MSKFILYIFALLIVLAVGFFAFLAFSPTEVEQNEVILDVPAERFE